MNVVLICAILAALLVSNGLLWAALCELRRDNAELRVRLSNTEDRFWTKTSDLKMNMDLLLLSALREKKPPESGEEG